MNTPGLLKVYNLFTLLARNEAEVGQAIKESGVKREDIFVVTKLRTTHHEYEECLKEFKASLEK